ncbi:UNVERIFIED_CONTAM: two-component system sensor histidine kinase YesM [Acetivibrio alkalicellulosi]
MEPRFRILNRINDISINTKFILISILCVILPILTLNLILLSSISNSIKERVEESFKISYDRAKADIIQIIRDGVAVSNSIHTDRVIYEELDYDYDADNEVQYFVIYTSSLRARIDRFFNIYRNISRITIYTSNKSIDSGGYCIIIDDEIRSTSWYKMNENSEGRLMLYSFIENRAYFDNRYNSFLSLIRSMDFHKEGFRERILRVDIDNNWIQGVLSREQEYLSLYIVDNQGRIVLATEDYVYEKDNIFNFMNFDDIEIKENDILFDFNLGEASYFRDWRLIGIPNKEIIHTEMKQARHFIILLALISILISGFLVLIVFRSYNYRIKKLSKHISKFGDERFDLIVINEGKDEIGQLIRQFNKMAAKINTLINDVYKLQIQKKDLELERVQAEINFLQSQMNPHFLFNTLNAILIVSVKNNYREIIDVIKYLSKTLRRLLSWKDDLVTVEEEINFTEMYLKIEKFRFSEKIKYNVLVDEDARELKIPKMSIQPLVENACKHGIQSIRGSGDITIEIKIVKKHLEISVKDNGIGISEDKVGEILMSMEDDIYTSGSIGIRNVYRRLKFYYGKDFKFFINSKKNKGTKVCFTIPAHSAFSDKTFMSIM